VKVLVQQFIKVDGKFGTVHLSGIALLLFGTQMIIGKGQFQNNFRFHPVHGSIYQQLSPVKGRSFFPGTGKLPFHRLYLFQLNGVCKKNTVNTALKLESMMALGKGPFNFFFLLVAYGSAGLNFLMGFGAVHGSFIRKEPPMHIPFLGSKVNKIMD
jgi:hypothetical protein